jgi:hypothetical protein
MTRLTVNRCKIENPVRFQRWELLLKRLAHIAPYILNLTPKAGRLGVHVCDHYTAKSSGLD